MVSTETMAFVTVSYRGVAAFVPNSLEQKMCEMRAVTVVLFGSFSGHLEARASVWCSVVCCFLLVVLLAAD